MRTATVDLVDDRPRMRGVLHQYGAAGAAAAGAALVAGSAALRGPGVAVACIVYALAVTGMLAVSATYHRARWRTARSRLRMKRADHSMIFVLIAGTYTPFCATELAGTTRWWVLGAVWVAALAGASVKTIWPDSPRWLGITLYIAFGWGVLGLAPVIVTRGGLIVAGLLAVGGLLYTVGGLLYGAQRPNPWPATFGHHEVFHACTVIAVVLHYAAVWLVVAG